MKNENCLIGYSGFIGSNLKNSDILKFKDFYNTSNILDITNKKYNLCVCSAPSATKWKINQDPLSDLGNIINLCNILKTVHFEKFVLLSTIDIYDSVDCNKDESDYTTFTGSSYGQNRGLFENIILDLFCDKVKIIRLPALYGKGLKKNIIYDLMNGNMIENISLETEFQWYDVSDLEYDIDRILGTKDAVHNLFPEPLLTKTIVENYFPSKLKVCLGKSNKSYRVKTRHTTSGYLYNKEVVLDKIGRFLK